MNRSRPGQLFLVVLSPLVLARCGGVSSDVGDRPLPDNAACMPGERTRPDGSCQPAGLPSDMSCLPGERARPDGRCQPAGLPLDMPCPPGERARPDGSCQAAGVPPEACAAGRFAPDGRGGCAAILPDTACPWGQMAVPGERACRDVASCGEGPWNPDIPVETTTEYVDQAYAGSDSDGSIGKPWKTVQEGVRAASSGALVAVAAGRYTEDVVIADKRVRLWGLCPARTVVVGPGLEQDAITVASDAASGSEVRGLAVTGSRVGVVVRDARSVVLEEVWVHETGAGGVYILSRAGVTVRGALVEENLDVGVYVSGSEATIEATVVRATQLDGAGRFGRGIIVQPSAETGEGGTLSLIGSLIEENHEVGVLVAGSEATIEATVVRATQPSSNGRGGMGVVVRRSPETGEGGKLSLTGSLIAENRGMGVFVWGSEATIDATVVRATQLNDDGTFGRGINVETDLETGEGGKLSLTASLVEKSHDVGVFVAGSEATIEATVVRATQPSGDGTLGRGIVVQADMETGVGGTLSLTASLVEENHDVGVFVAGSEAMILATVVRATKRAPAGLEFGDGILLLDEPRQSSATISASESTGNARAGVMYVGSTGELSFVRSSGNGFGLVLQSGESGSQPRVGESNAFGGNTEQDQVAAGDLPVPDVAVPVP